MRDIEWKGWKHGKGWEEVSEIVSVGFHTIANEDRLFVYVLDKVFRLDGLIGRLSFENVPCLIPIESGIDLPFSGIEDWADEVRSGRDLGGQYIEGRDTCHWFLSSKS